jgi:hypothetical protein
MPLRARVGRHAKTGGRNCQNWADDQKTVIDLLNKIPAAGGGAGGTLKPRIVAGIASKELYAAIAAFEAKHFPGQGSGYFDPGGAMFKKLVALGTPAPAPPARAAPPPPPAPSPPPEPTSGPIPRPLTQGEKDLLHPIFGDTLGYDSQMVARNDRHTGGEYNSFTPGYIPNMSPHIWSWDYSKASDSRAAVFVHEMVHVWQSGHGRHNVLRGIYLWAKYDDYADAYKYDLDSSASLGYFNMEQQAAIIEDYYLVSKGLTPDNNEGTRKSKADYLPYVAQLKTAGAFQKPLGRLTQTERDYIGHNM